ncbi:MAG: helix-turn-helix domain-containing protein [Aestuariivirga sp.]
MTVLISLDEAAARLGIGKTLLRAHVSHGTIRYVSVGAGSKRRRLMFTLSDLAEFIQERSRRELSACPPSSPRARKPTPTTSSSTVVGFSALQERRKSAPPRR